jgi:hypothetical protein
VPVYEGNTRSQGDNHRKRLEGTLTPV